MIVSHVEAGRKICPVINLENKLFHCVSDGCMAWRDVGVDHQGYCGLAGKTSQVLLTELHAAASMAKDMDIIGGAK